MKSINKKRLARMKATHKPKPHEHSQLFMYSLDVHDSGDLLEAYDEAIRLLEDASKMLHWTCACTSPAAPKDIDDFLNKE